jgi:hypothetical protein
MDHSEIVPAGVVPNALQLACVQCYYETGSLAEVSRQTMVPIYELQKLEKQLWWQQELHLIRRCEQAALESRFTKILGEALAGIEDRLEVGDTQIDRYGIEHKIPVEAATLVRVAELVFDKRQLLRGLPTNISEDNGKLQDLANKLEKIGRAQAARTIDSKEIEREDSNRSSD